MAKPAFNYHDIGEELAQIGDKLVEEGKMIPNAIQDLVAYKDRFGYLDGRFVALDSGVSADVIVRQMLADRPHWAWPTISDAAFDAFGDNPSLAARGRLLKDIGQAAYDLEMKRWGASSFNLKPGTRPVIGKDETTKPKPGIEDRDNPWLINDARNLARRIEIINNPKLGPRVASALAKAAGVTLAGTPLRQS